MSQSSTTGVSTLLVSENMIIANYLTAKFASDNNIKILYRYLDPNFNEELVKEYNDIMKEQDSTGTDQLVQMYSFLPEVQLQTSQESTSLWDYQCILILHLH